MHHPLRRLSATLLSLEIRTPINVRKKLEDIVKRAFKLIPLLLCLCVAVCTAYAQGNCTLQTMMGTYAMYERGSSFLIDPSQQPYPLHWAAAMATFVNVGEVTFSSNGVGNGFYWIELGALNGGLDPIPVQVTITEMNPDCTGKFTYVANLPGGLSATVEERFVLFDNGREFRSIPTTITNGVPTLAWIGTGHRISKPGKMRPICGPQNAQGKYLVTVENIIDLDPKTAFSDTVLLTEDVAMNGDYTGTLYEKLGPIGPIQLPINGKITVNPDCSMTSSLNVETITGPIMVKGVFYNEGKDYYAMAIIDLGNNSQFMYSLFQGKRIGQ